MKISKLLAPIGLVTVACSAIIPITSCGIKNTWSDSKDKKVRFVPIEKVVHLNESNLATVVYEIDRPLVETDFEQTTVSLQGVTIVEQKIEAPYITLTCSCDRSQFSSWSIAKFVFTCPNYRVINDNDGIQFVYED